MTSLLEWSGPKENNIFVVNASMRTHGIAEPQLSLTRHGDLHVFLIAYGDVIYSISVCRPP
ncbi:hypothetical protein AB2H74_23835 (plasmid) [Escherichia coli]